jgi:hypothetical protein
MAPYSSSPPRLITGSPSADGQGSNRHDVSDSRGLELFADGVDDHPQADPGGKHLGDDVQTDHLLPGQATLGLCLSAAGGDLPDDNTDRDQKRRRLDVRYPAGSKGVRRDGSERNGTSHRPTDRPPPLRGGDRVPPTPP